MDEKEYIKFAYDVHEQLTSLWGTRGNQESGAIKVIKKFESAIREDERKRLAWLHCERCAADCEDGIICAIGHLCNEQKTVFGEERADPTPKKE